MLGSLVLFHIWLNVSRYSLALHKAVEAKRKCISRVALLCDFAVLHQKNDCRAVHAVERVLYGTTSETKEPSSRQISLRNSE